MRRYIFLVSTVALWGVALFPIRPLGAATRTWDAGTDFNWDSVTANWSAATYTDGDDAVFGNTGTGTITLTGTLSPNSVVFQNSSGNNYVFTGGDLSGSGSLTMDGSGRVEFGELDGSPSSPAMTFNGGTFVNSGVLSWGRTSGSFGSGAITLNGGTFRVGANNNGSYSVANDFVAAANGGRLYNQNSGNTQTYTFSGDFSGSGALTLESSGSNVSVMTGDNSGYTGTLTIVSPADIANRGGIRFNNAADFFTGAASIVTEGALMFSYAVADAELAAVAPGVNGGLVSVAGGDLKSLTNPLDYVGINGKLMLENRDTLVADRIGDTTALAFDKGRVFSIIGRNSSNAIMNETIGALSFTGGSKLLLDKQNTSAGVRLTAASLALGTAADSLLIESDVQLSTVGSNNDNALFVTGSKPTVVNGMVTPAIQSYTGGNTQGAFMTFSGDNLIPATSTSTDWDAAGVTDIVQQASGNDLDASTEVYALRTGGSLNFGGNTLTVGSGGLIMSNHTLSNGTLNFGTNRGFVGTYNTASQGALDVTLTGSGGITFLGDAQSTDISGNNTGLTGDIFVDSSSITLEHANALNGQNLTVNGSGRVMIDASTVNIGGLAGTGTVQGDFQGSSSTIRTLAIDTGAGSYSFDGTLQNGADSLAVTKTGSGTQTFTGTSTYTRTTTVNGGTLSYDGASVSDGEGHTVNSGGTLDLQGDGLSFSTAEIVVNAGGSFSQTGSGTWQTDLFHVNGSGGTLQVADLAQSTDGDSTLRFTIDSGGAGPIEFTDSNPFGLYSASAATGANQWASEWTLDLNAVGTLGLTDFPEVTLFSSTGGYSLNGLIGKLDVVARDENGVVTTYNNVGDGAPLYIQSGSNLAGYFITFDSGAIALSFTSARAIPEPGTLSLLGLAALALRRRLQGPRSRPDTVA